MSDEHELERLTQQAPVVVFHSPVTDLAGIDDALIEAGVDWTRVFWRVNVQPRHQWQQNRDGWIMRAIARLGI